MSISQPNNTLYVSNIDWKVKKPMLRRALYTLLSRHGKILEIITLRGEGLRGQAWVIFDDVQAATAALQAENGFPFFGKDLRLAYAKSKSDRIAKRDGTYVPKSKRRKVNNHDGDDDDDGEHNNSNKLNHDGTTMSSDEGGEGGGGGGRGAGPSSMPGGNHDNDATRPPPPPPPAAPQEAREPPSRILFAQDLPTDCNSMMLEMLFRQYKGFREVRLPRSGLAFIEFDEEPHATVALQALNGFQLSSKHRLNLDYGKQ